MHRGEREAAREFSALLHLVDRAVRERDDQPEPMPSDRSWQPGQHGGSASISYRIFVVVILIGHHQDANAVWLFGHVYPPVVGGLIDAAPALPGRAAIAGWEA